MQIFNYANNDARQILALGPESNGNFSFFRDKKIYFSEDFSDLLVDANFRKFKSELNNFLKEMKAKPDIILTDLHPLYKTTKLGKDLAKKYKAEHIQIQHHIAHIFSQIGGEIINTNSGLRVTNYELRDAFGIALDGTGYGLDEKIWGGECFAISNFQFPISNEFSNSNDKISKQKIKIERIGHLENQTMIGGDLAVQEPARMLISILSKFLSKEKTYQQIKKHYSTQEFEVLYNQLQQNFNCIETSSTGRILDAVSILLGFCKNERKHKHEPVFALEANSAKPYSDIKPKITTLKSNQISNFQFPMTKFPKNDYILNTTFLFEYLIKNLHKDKSRLAATAQLYIAQGLHKIVTSYELRVTNYYIAGGISNNKIISAYFESEKNKAGTHSRTPAVQIPRGDAGLSLGQVIYYLLTNPRN
ncbi:MAG: hypothetical protein COX30_00035 [Candidatus Moranbacteria bacterium CG23_combo_of_CG06-09_8_20_14_all_39_10]|nr:MAG: hypothetical protein COX30_00035 [Candidatus Moranbacteria bacterium CG23_combo_of_CG06-09_8_20_14_all_39_10]